MCVLCEDRDAGGTAAGTFFPHPQGLSGQFHLCGRLQQNRADAGERGKAADLKIQIWGVYQGVSALCQTEAGR